MNNQTPKALSDWDRDVFEALFESCLPRLKRYALRLTRNVNEADDLVQDVLLRICQCPERWPEQSPGVPAWVMRVAYNVFIDSCRRRSVERNVISFEALAVELSACSDGAPESGWMNSGETEDPISSGYELCDFISTALRALPERYRNVVYWHDIEGLSAREIAERLGIPLNTVRSTISRGHAMVKQYSADAFERRSLAA